MAASGVASNVRRIHHPEFMRSILAGIVETGDVIGAAGPGRTILASRTANRSPLRTTACDRAWPALARPCGRAMVSGWHGTIREHRPEACDPLAGSARRYGANSPLADGR